MPPDAGEPPHRPVGPGALACRCVRGAYGTANKEKRIVVSYRSTPGRTAVGYLSLITCAAGALYTAYNARHREPMGRRGAGVASGGMSYRMGVTFVHVCARIRTRGAIFRILHLATCHVWQSHMPGYGLQC